LVWNEGDIQVWAATVLLQSARGSVCVINKEILQFGVTIIHIVRPHCFVNCNSRIRTFQTKYTNVVTGLFKMSVGVLTTCHTQHTSDSSICIFLSNRTALPVFVTYLTGALYVHRL
jgi:hypothetical protein